MRDYTEMFGVSLKVNGNDFGWNQVYGEYGSHNFYVWLDPQEPVRYLQPGKSVTLQVSYFENDFFSNLKVGSNTFLFHINDDDDNGKVQELDENNNDYEYIYDAYKCKDDEPGATNFVMDFSTFVKGTVELYGVKLDDYCFDQGKALMEYWCYKDFVVGTSSSSCTCINGACIQSQASCTDSIKNQDETDIDCGGSCAPCSLGKNCAAHAHCSSNYCSPITHVCETCADSDALNHPGVAGTLQTGNGNPISDSCFIREWNGNSWQDTPAGSCPGGTNRNLFNGQTGSTEKSCTVMQYSCPTDDGATFAATQTYCPGGCQNGACL